MELGDSLRLTSPPPPPAPLLLLVLTHDADISFWEGADRRAVEARLPRASRVEESVGARSPSC